MRGELLFFNQQSAHGFIRTEDGERLYVAGASFALGHVPEGRCAGTLVEFTRGVGTGDHAFEAVGVTRVVEALGGRARLRSTRKSTR